MKLRKLYIFQILLLFLYSCKTEIENKENNHSNCITIKHGKYQDSIVFRCGSRLQILYFNNGELTSLRAINSKDETQTDAVYFDESGDISDIHIDETHKIVGNSGITSAKAWIDLDSLYGIVSMDVKMKDTTYHIENKK